MSDPKDTKAAPASGDKTLKVETITDKAPKTEAHSEVDGDHFWGWDKFEKHPFIALAILAALVLVCLGVYKTQSGSIVTTTTTTEISPAAQKKIDDLTKKLAALSKPAADADKTPAPAADATAPPHDQNIVPPAANGIGNAACRQQLGDYLGTDGRCHPAQGANDSRDSRRRGNQGGINEKARFEAFAKLCNEQSKKRQSLGLPGVMVLDGGPGRVSTCHVAGGVVENGRI